MTDDFDEIFSGNHNTTETTATTPDHDDSNVSIETTEEPVTQEEPVTETAAEAVEEVTQEQEEKAAKNVPLATFLDMRDRAKAAEKLAEERQKQWDEHQQSQQASANIPNPQDDPIAYADYRFEQLEQQRVNDRMAVSAQFAKRTHGDEIVNQAVAWAQTQAETDPRFDQAVLAESDPISWVVEQHKAAKQLQEFQTDPEAFARKMALEKGWLAAPEQQVAATIVAPLAAKPTAQKVIPTSLTDVPAASGKSTHQSETEDFDAIFNKR